MKILRIFFGAMTALALLTGTLLAGCTAAPAAVSTPTMSAETLVAAAVETLSAQMTDEAIRNPPATPTSTHTPEPTATITPIPPTETPALPTDTPAPTATSAPAVSAKFLTSSAYPENKASFTPNERFSVSIRFMNTGTATWPAGTTLKLTGFEGEVTVQTEAVTNQAIEPGKVIEFDLWAYGSETLGKHVWFFQVYSASGFPIPGGYGYYSYTSV